MAEPRMLQVIYRSRSIIAAPLQDMEVRAIVSASERNNKNNNITGFLLFDQQWFVQVLEGDEEAIRATYEKIRRDARHTDLTVLSEREVRARAFPEWSMGAAIRSAQNADVFDRHGIDGSVAPESLTCPAIVALAMDLQDHHRMRRLGVASLAAGPLPNHHRAGIEALIARDEPACGYRSRSPGALAP